MAAISPLCIIDSHQLAAIVRKSTDNTLVVDTRSFLEFNVSHIISAINVGCAKLMKRRLQQERIGIKDFLTHNCHLDIDESYDIFVYDQSSEDPGCLSPDSFLYVFLEKLLPVFKSVNFLQGGFLQFQATYPKLCQDEKRKCTPLTSLSQPCLPISNHGPTRILPFLYLGSQHDALNKEVLQDHNITYELNVSTSCPKPDFIQEANFMRIAVNDNYSEKLLPHFPNAFQFLDKARESGGCVLVHCLAGISRSATVAIAYVMKHLKMSSDDAYRYVKSKRASISPNFNFLGQLLEFEKQLHNDNILKSVLEISTAPISCSLSSLPPGRFETGSSFRDRECKRTVINRNRRPSCCADFSNISKCSSGDKLTMKRVQMMNKRQEGFFSFKQTLKSSVKVEPRAGCDGQWYVNNLPVASLKEINFMPCQAPIENASEDLSTKHYSELERQSLSIDSLLGTEFVQRRDSKQFDFALFDTVLSECKLESGKNFSTLPQDLHSRSDTLLSPNSNVNSSESGNKEFSRSDSVSTSGLGSEGSDCADSWNDYHSSYERETDILMDDEYGTVPSEDNEYQRRSALLYGDSCEESLYGKYDVLGYAEAYPRSPLSPSEKHFMEDFPYQLSGIDDYHIVGDGKCHEVPFKIPEYAHTGNGSQFSKSDGLHRAQSCPGMTSFELPMKQTCNSEEFLKNGAPCFMRNKSASVGKAGRCKNRYSCSSLDYMDYTSHVSFTHDSSPDVMPYAAPRRTSPSSQRTHRHSMIEVS